MIIMYEGKMEAIASSYRLKTKYSKKGHLVVQFTRGHGDEGNMDQLKRLLDTKLQGFTVKWVV